MTQLAFWGCEEALEEVERPTPTLATGIASGTAATPRPAPPKVIAAPAQEPFRWDAPTLSTALTEGLGRAVRVVITDNRSTMVSSRSRGAALEVRLHRMFETAPPEVILALAAYFARSDRTAGKVIDDYIDENLTSLRRGEVACEPRGRFHHLGEIFDELNRTYFHGASQARITWGNAGSRRYRRSIQLGCYVRDDQLIRMHPCLDQAFVPRFYVAWIVFHEMLHEVFGVERRGGRHSVHPPEFVAIEQSYPDYARCKAWERQHIHRLLRFHAGRS